MLSRRPTTRSRRGASAVEFAIIGPVAILVFAAGIDIGRIRVLQHTVDNVAYEAAQSGLDPGATKDKVIELAENRLLLYRTKDPVIAVEADRFGMESHSVTVRIRIPLRRNSWLLSSSDRSVAGQSTVRSNRSVPRGGSTPVPAGRISTDLEWRDVQFESDSL